MTSGNQPISVPNQTDVFVVDATGALNVAWIVQGNPWGGPIPISKPGFAPPRAAVTTCQQFGVPNQSWHAAAALSGPTVQLAGRAVAAAGGQTLCVLVPDMGDFAGKGLHR